MLASVVIPTHDRPEALGRCLDALGRQTVEAGWFEVVVVDDGSSPALVLEAERWAGKFRLSVVRQANTGPAGARNRGVVAAQGEVVVFTDDDCLPEPDWLEIILAAWRENPEALVGGSTYNGLSGDLFAETSNFILDLVYAHFNASPEEAYFFASNNIACGRQAYLEQGGFDISFCCWGGEDRDFCDRWRAAGRTLRWVPGARIEHRHGQSLGKFVRLHFRYGQGAYIYQAKRRQRGAGTMQADLAFHGAFPRLMCRQWGRYRWPRRLGLLRNLAIWHLANAAGFAREAWRFRGKGGRLD